uniref:CD3324 family protein n=1 Tax=Acetatifactor sp. TaxID=1872090 RepID=UPI004055F63B
MKYVNAADVLPNELLIEISKYAGGKLLYVPTLNEKCSWGEKSGSKQYFQERNQKMRELFQQGKTLDDLSEEFGLSCETIKRIVR